MDIAIGEKVLRRKVSGGDTIEWVITTVNETYLPLIKEFPEDYRTIGQLQKENLELKEKYENVCKHKINLSKMNSELQKKLIDAGLMKPIIKKDYRG